MYTAAIVQRPGRLPGVPRLGPRRSRESASFLVHSEGDDQVVCHTNTSFMCLFTDIGLENVYLVQDANTQATDRSTWKDITTCTKGMKRIIRRKLGNLENVL